MADLKRTLYLVLGVLALMALSAVSIRAESDRTSWNNLAKAKRGEEVEIVSNDAMSYKGTLKSWNDGGIVAQVSTGEMTFTRSDVMRVARHKPSHRLRHTVVAAGIGGAVGGIFSTTCGRSLACPIGSKKVAVTSVTAGLGALVGVVLPSGQGWEVIYRRP